MLIPKKNEVRKPSRTMSGVAPLAVMLPPRKCEHGNCLYCPSLNVPQSYTPKSPVVLRASQVDYDAYEQVRGRLKAFKVMNHSVDKVEMIIMGGTFLQYSKEFQYEFVKACYDGLNGKKSASLEKAQKLNEKAKCRCVALCIETRPDVCVEFIGRLREFGCTRVEIGVQMPDDAIYKKNKRGHSVKDVALATRELKDAGFKVGYHIMPGLLGSNIKKDLRLFKKLFLDERFKPDQIKIYPCQVLKGADLEDLYWKKKYKPYDTEQIKDLLIKMMKMVPRYCRVMRVMREIPPEYLVAGTTKIDLRKDVEEELRNNKEEIKEIRFREVGFNSVSQPTHPKQDNLKLKITKYKASGGDEYFLEIVNNGDILFGLLRLRILEGEAIIRELHVYGKALKLDEKGEFTPKGVHQVGARTSSRPRGHIEDFMPYKGQHKGLGKWLMKEAEEIVVAKGMNKISVISGVGVRGYYEKLGYELEDSYMVKNL